MNMRHYTLREKTLKSLYKLTPFNPAGDCIVRPGRDGIKISCIINFYGRLDLLSGILFSLAGQNLDHALFEVVLVEDRGGTEGGRETAEEFKSLLPVVYSPLDNKYGFMGHSRNHGISISRGKYILFLDDDTVIQQADFLSVLLHKFESDKTIDAVVPRGGASYALLKGKYAYHDPYFMTNRCMAYRRETLMHLGGFISDVIGQEDVEFAVRFLVSGRIAINASDLEYFHPPLVMPNFRKPKAVGNSFYRLKNRYPAILWLLLIINCARHAPLYFMPIRKYREMGRFALGFLLGVFMSPFKTEGFRYS